MTSEEIVSRILFRDALMLVIDKPAGLPVHPGHGGGETLERHLDALRFGLPKRPQIVHRLDRNTSGCLVRGRHAKAISRLNKLFEERKVDKVYWAVVKGRPREDAGEIDLAISPLAPDMPWRSKIDPDGQEAVTQWRVLARDPKRALLELRPLTGRTHQLRVHCAAMGWPIIGDSVYGDAHRGRRDEGRKRTTLLLHARRVTIPLYPKKPAIIVEAPLPDHMQPLVEALMSEGIVIDDGGPTISPPQPI
jgi:tRNA pseudouridine32 synthase / 23S rRNA pseudouridine746 synthase